jgi:adenylylsulfate kinase-like enzyme
VVRAGRAATCHGWRAAFALALSYPEPEKSGDSGRRRCETALMLTRGPQVAWLYGPPGVGKSTTGWALYDQFTAAGLTTAYVDIDQVGMCYPPHDSDPDRHHIKARSAGQVLENFRAAGAQRIVVSGVLEPRAFIIYLDQLRGVDVTFCRLTVGLEELRRRNLERGGRDREDLAQAVREAVDLDHSDLVHPVIDTQDTTVEEATRRVAALLGADVETCITDASRVDVRSSALDGYRPALAAGRVIFICGPTGVGKSAVAWELFTRLRAAGRTAGFVDLAQIGFLSPGRPEDPDHVRLKSANLAALWDTFAAAGADHVVVNGSIASEYEVQAYRAVLPHAEVTICRLTADEPSLRSRVFERRLGEGLPLAGDNLKGQPDDKLHVLLHEAARMDQLLNASDLGDVLIDTTGASIDGVATAIAHEAHLNI